MSGSRLSRLQARVLRTLAAFDPAWTLTGGGALVGFHLQHRITRDLELFWHGERQLGGIGDRVAERLIGDGLTVSAIQTAQEFRRFRVSNGAEVVILDLVADPSDVIEPPVWVQLEDVQIQLDTLHEILVNKLCALLGRLELRDLQDVRALLEAGGDLGRALADAPRKDGGFSPLTLAWVLRCMDCHAMAHAIGMRAEEAGALTRFQDELIDRLTASGSPE